MNYWQASPPRSGRRRWIWAVALIAVILLGSCRATTEPTATAAVDLSLDAVPLLLKADTTQTAIIWATVLEAGEPVADSTVVSFVASLGTIDAEAYTRDGLARALFVPDPETGVAAVIAQVKAVRDTVLITLY